MEKISLITGATGHIGYALLKELVDNGEKVRILIRKDVPVFDGIDCEKVYGDVTDSASLEKAFEGVDVVYHLAGVIDINPGMEDLTWKVNVNGTKNVVRACKRCNVRRLVYASSVDAFPPLPDNQLMTELDHFDPKNLDGTYAKTNRPAFGVPANNAQWGGFKEGWGGSYSSANRPIIVSLPRTKSPTATNISVFSGRYISTREPNLMKPRWVFLCDCFPTFA